MKIEIIIADETGKIDIVNKTLKEQDYTNYIRELETELKQEGENRHIEQVIELGNNNKPTQKPTHTPTQNQHLNNNQFKSIKHRKK
jgi:hypothetical protein